MRMSVPCQTSNYLFFGSENVEECLSPAEKEIIRVYRSLDDRRKKCIQETLRYFKESSKKKNEWLKTELSKNHFL